MKIPLLLAVWVVAGLGGLGWAQGGPQDGWTGRWIGAPWSTSRDGAEADGSRPMPVFRREFVVRGKVTRAELRIAGLGQFEARLDGRAVGRPGLHQAWTDYHKTVAYESYDVTGAMSPGSHAWGVMLGNGMYNVQRSVLANGKARYTKFEGSFGAPRLIAELQLTYSDGRKEVVGTDEGWRVAPGPVVFSSTYGGEDYDARKEERGWDRIGFRDGSWAAATVVEGPGGRLLPALAPEVEEREVHVPVKTTDVGQARVVYDLGQNSAGVIRVKVRGPRGASLRLTPGELLNPDGSVSQASSGGPMWWTYTLAGDEGGETWQPRFGYYGFRYVQAEWVDGAAGKLDELRGVAWSSGSKGVGSFVSSNELLNRIHGLIENAMRNNEVSVFTDCPHREKLGWLEETHLIAAGLMFNDDLEGLYRATERNIGDAQGADGMVPTIAPRYTVFGPKNAIYDDSPEWGSAAVLGPWAAFRFYGDLAELKRSYPVMQRYVTYLEGTAKDGIVAYGLGDWYDIGPGGPGFEKNTTLGVTGTLMLYEDAAAMARIARLLGFAADAARYEGLARREAEAFNRRFWDAEHGWYDTGSQTANAMPLALGIVPEERRSRVLTHVIDDIHAHQDHVTTGEVGYPYLLRALMAAGRDDVVMALMMRTDPPSYGSQLAAGATALTEAWDANPKSSQDHFMLGAAEEWFYRGLGGIGVDLSQTGTERIVVRPRVVAGVDWVKCGFNSRLGKVESDWNKAGDEVAFEVTVPVEATVELPDGRREMVAAGMHRFVVKDDSTPGRN